MIMHGTWYKGPQLAHRTHTHSDYHRDYTPTHHQAHHLHPHHSHHHQAPPPPPPPPTHLHSHSHHPHPYRSYPSFVVAPYHESPPSAAPTPASTPIPTHTPAACLNGVPAPILVEGTFAAAAVSNSAVGINQLASVLSPTIKIEQPFGEPLSVDEYALNLDCNIENTFREQQQKHILKYSDNNNAPLLSAKRAAAILIAGTAVAAAAADVLIPVGSGRS
ncbi:zinc finger protein rotund-like [Bactrocera neohumeralis]|uniref:zinc finger protein rotund-like n=1 Tax=Bactrocera neohumeralis TaxID=98809 RepID=UPI002164FB87|nr:zinc finger protein rotund-like [Bactrocera neohumeralis]